MHEWHGAPATLTMHDNGDVTDITFRSSGGSDEVAVRVGARAHSVRFTNAQPACGLREWTRTTRLALDAMDGVSDEE